MEGRTHLLCCVQTRGEWIARNVESAEWFESSRADRLAQTWARQWYAIRVCARLYWMLRTTPKGSSEQAEQKSVNTAVAVIA